MTLIQLTLGVAGDWTDNGPCTSLQAATAEVHATDSLPTASAKVSTTEVSSDVAKPTSTSTAVVMNENENMADQTVFQVSVTASAV